MAICVYLLQPCRLPHSLTHSYVGFTVNLANRIRKHNGEIVGGAKKTTLHRPWRIVTYVTGFKTQQEALKFEWMFQHTLKSKASRAIIKENMYRKHGFGPAYSAKRKVAELRFILTLKRYQHLKAWRA